MTTTTTATTTATATTAGAIIIGGGCIGTSIALHLARAGVRNVLLLERAHLCAGTTGQSGAIIRQHYSHAFTAIMARDSLHVFRHWRESIGYGDPRFVQSGVLVTAGEADADALRANVAMQQGVGIDTHLLTPDDVRALDPRITTDDLALACWEPTAGYADPVATVFAFVAAARAAGVTIREGATVTDVRHASGRVRGVTVVSGATGATVETVDAPIVVNAANIWGVGLLRRAGLELPIIATRHPMAALRRPEGFGPAHTVILDMARATYLLPRGDDTSLVGSINGADDAITADPDTYAPGVSRAEIAHFTTEGVRRVPALAGAVAQGGWAGLYDSSADAHPVLDEVPGIAGYYCAVGFSGHGFKLSPVFGQLLAARIIAGPDAAPALAPLRATRFADGTALDTRYTAGVLA